jgi:pyrroline-5-carboxylate reductase
MNDKIAIIGTGMMGGAIIKSLLKGGYQGKITAVDIQPERLKEFENLGVKTSTDNKKAASDADIIFIIVKPGDVEKVLKEISQ